LSKTGHGFQIVLSKGVLLAVFLVLIILVLTFIFGDRGIVEVVRMNKRIAVIESSIRLLEQEKKNLQDELTQLQNDPRTIEQKAREKLWLMKKNEKVIVLVKEKRGNAQ